MKVKCYFFLHFQASLILIIIKQNAESVFNRRVRTSQHKDDGERSEPKIFKKMFKNEVLV